MAKLFPHTYLPLIQLIVTCTKTDTILTFIKNNKDFNNMPLMFQLTDRIHQYFNSPLQLNLKTPFTEPLHLIITVLCTTTKTHNKLSLTNKMG